MTKFLCLPPKEKGPREVVLLSFGRETRRERLQLEEEMGEIAVEAIFDERDGLTHKSDDHVEFLLVQMRRNACDGCFS